MILNWKSKYPDVVYCKLCKHLKGNLCTKKGIDVSKKKFIMFCDEYEPK